MKVPNNKLSSLKTYFIQSLEASRISEASNYFSYLVDAWLDISKSDLILNPDLEISESEILRFFYALKDLKKNRPIQYVAGVSWFYGLKIGVREGVLIPRPETEELVDWVVNEAKDAKVIVDIGTGSGCIPLSIKSKLAKPNIIGLDISEDALNIATENAEILGLDVKFDKFNALDWKEYSLFPKADIIVSNPPYIPESDKKMMHDNVLYFEPSLALFVEDEAPLVFYKSIADFAIQNLVESGSLFFEIHESFGEKTKIMLESKGFKNIELRKDLQGKDRMIKACFYLFN